MNTNNIPIRGNICTCSGVWFCYDIPESDPSRCPYCSRQIDTGEVCGDEDIQDQISNGEIPEELSKNIGKATGNINISLVPKVCDFCTNELFFDEVDAPNAQHCPYCEGKLLELDQFKALMGLDMSEDEIGDGLDGMLGANMGELVGETVSIEFKSGEDMKGEFKGLDLITSMIKISCDGQIIWASLNEIKLIKVLESE